MMTLEQLRIFVAVAEREHVTRAADALRLTQSAVSAAIAALEAHSRLPLFHRVGRRIELSVEGRFFLEEARSLLARADAAERMLVDLSGLNRGTLLVQASQTIGGYWLPQRLATFAKTYPGIDIQFSIGNTAQVAKAVSEGSAELGFIEGQIEASELSSTVVASDRLIVIAAANYPGLVQGPLTADDLARADWVLRETGSGTRSEFEMALGARGFEPKRLRVVLELSSNEAIRTAVEAGAGVTAISELVAASGLRSGALAQVEFDLPERPFHMLRHRDRHASRATEAFVAMLSGT